MIFCAFCGPTGVPTLEPKSLAQRSSLKCLSSEGLDEDISLFSIPVASCSVFGVSHSEMGV